jgi:putative ABC transport system ATP-binding protein
MIPSHAKPVVSIRSMTKRYVMGSTIVEALREVSLDVYKGQFIAIMGPSGSGKSTLLHLMGCLDRPSSGVYELDGKDVAQLDDNHLSLVRATQIGFVFQSFNLIPQLNVKENVEVPFHYQQLLKEHYQQSLLKAIERVGMSHRLHHLPRELSGGEIQRVAIARALAIDPVLILADEPTGNLDSENGKKILSLFQELHKQGVTVIMVTHDELVARHAEKIIRMRDGRIISQETTKQTVDHVI